MASQGEASGREGHCYQPDLVERSLSSLVHKTDTIDDPLIRGAAQLAVAAPVIGYVLIKDAVNDAHTARRGAGRG
jgi:hypothetical protein